MASNRGNMTVAQLSMTVEQLSWMLLNSLLGTTGVTGAAYTLWTVYKFSRENRSNFKKQAADIRSIEADTDIKLDKARLDAIVDLTKQLDIMRTTIAQLEQANAAHLKELAFCKEQLELLRNYNTMLKGILRGRNIPIPD